MIVAEKPGPDENVSMRPFTGPSGQLLRNYMKTARLSLDFDCYYTNVVKCMPPAGRKPSVKEINQCKMWLEREFKFVDPDIVVAMGEVSTSLLLPGETKKITQIHGNVYERELYGRTRLVVPTIHPAFVARNPKTLALWLMNDLRLIKRLKSEGLNRDTKFRTTPGTWDEVLETITHSVVGLDFETDPPVDIKDTHIIGIGVCSTEENGVYYAFASHEDAAEKLESIRHFFEGPTIKVISNAAFEMAMLANYGIILNNYEDTMLQAWVAGDFPLSLKDGIHRAFNIEMIRIDRFYKLGYTAQDYHMVSKSQPNGKKIVNLEAAQQAVPDAVAEYASQDPDASLRLNRYLRPRLIERGLQDLYENVELPFVRVLADIERTGFQFDASRLDAFSGELDRAETEIHARLLNLVGREINVNSTPQVIRALYHDPSHGFGIPEADDIENPTPTDKTALAFHGNNPLVRAILTERAIRKMRGTYVEALPRWQLPDGRIYPRFHQSAAETGRMSSTRPNITNQPSRKRDDIDVPLDGGLIRYAYVARPGCAIVAADISQIEKRFSAHLSQDPDMLYYLSDKSRDIHGNTTTKMFGITKETVDAREWKNKRDTGKMIGFGIDYGLSGMGLILRAPQAGFTIDEANALIEAYYATYPGVREWQLKTKHFAYKHGYVESIMGRRRYIPEITSKSMDRRNEAGRQAINMPIQGSAADFFKAATLRVYDFIIRNNLATKIVALVHDEIVMEAPYEELDLLAANVPDLMANAIPLSLPVFIDFEVGDSWGEVKEYDKWKLSHSGT
jgi:DNA polymerase-1